jgi:hypothetical protein
MAESRLNSIHLEAQPRRDDFRQARDRLLGSRGKLTLAGEDQQRQGGDSGKLVTCPAPGRPVDCRYVLMDKDYVYPLNVGINTIGRMPDNDVVLEDGGISRRHCAILVHSRDAVEVHDTASKNGTFVNGRRLSSPTRLVSGDEIRICSRQLILMKQSEEPDSPLPFSPPSPTMAE